MYNKYLTKSNTIFMIKTVNELGLPDKRHLQKPTGNIILNGAKLNPFPLRSRMR